MLYKINWCDRKTTKVGEKFEAKLESPDGAMIDGVTLWLTDWPNVAPGHQVEGNIVEKPNGQYLNKTLYPVKENRPAPRGNNITKAQEVKRENIKEAQESKDISIKLSSTFRDATLITTAQMGTQHWDEADIKKVWLEWRKWLIANWGDSTDVSTPF